MIIATPQPLRKLFTHSATIAVALGCVAPLYYYARHLDANGSGWAIINLDDAAVALNRAPETLKANLYKGKNRGYFYAVKRSGRSFFVKYKSEVRIAWERGWQLGAISRSPISEIHNLKFLAADSQAESLQKSTYRNAALEVSRQNDGRYLPDYDAPFLIHQTSLESGGNWVLGQGKRYMYVAGNVAHFGGKQTTIAEQLGVSTRTVQRYLSNTYRVKRGAPAIDKFQLAVCTSVPIQGVEAIKSVAAETSDLDLFREAGRFFVQMVNGKKHVFIACTNLYNSYCVELSRQRWKRSKLNKLIKIDNDRAGGATLLPEAAAFSSPKP